MFKIISINNELTCYSIDEYGNVINNKTNRILKGSIYIGEYYSCSEAARQLNCDSSAVSKVCRGIYNHTHGFTFKYKE